MNSRSKYSIMAVTLGVVLALALLGMLNTGRVKAVRAATPTIVVDTLTDSNAPAYQVCADALNDCSLRGAISKANADIGNLYTIQLPAGTYALTLSGANEDDNATGDLDVKTNLTIAGAGADNTIINANQIDRVLQIHDGATVEIDGVTITGGKTPEGSIGSLGGNGGGSDGGGGIFIGINTVVTLTATSVISNSTGNGGAGGDGSVSNTWGGNGGSSGSGAGIYVVDMGTTTMTLNDCDIIGNTTGDGGDGGSGYNSIDGNGGGGGGSGHGGGIYVYNTSGDVKGALTLNHCDVADNRTGHGGNGGNGGIVYGGGNGGNGGDGGWSGGGGGINYDYGYESTLTITDSTIINNATGSGGKGGNGGNTIGNNMHGGNGGNGSSSGEGGGMIMQSDPGVVIKNSDISHNSTANGGDGGAVGIGLGIGGSDGNGGKGGDAGHCGGISNEWNLTIGNSSITHNATGNGGQGVGVAVGGNGGNGGGICDFYDMTITASVVNYNSTGSSGYGGGGSGYSGAGGGVFGAGTLINSIIAGNYGGGLYAEGSVASLVHTTIANNTGGAGIHLSNFDWGGGVDYSTVTLRNTIIVSQTVGVYVENGSTANLDTTLWGSGAWANGADWAGTGTIITGTRNYWGDPGFVAPATGDYHIGGSSAAIDKGVDAGVTNDIDNQPRPNPNTNIPDLGADEYWICTAISEVGIEGPVTGAPNSPLGFTGIVTPSAATPNIQYTWSPVPQAGQGTPVATYAFATTGDAAIQLTAQNCGGSRAITHTIHIQTPTPGVPVLISPVNSTLTTSQAITFTWQASAGGTPLGYNVQVDGNIITTTGTTSPTILAIGAHTWSVRAYNALGYSDWAPTWTITVVQAVGVPILLAPPNGTVTTTHAIAFAWQAGAGGIPTGYNLQVDGSVITTTGTTSATFFSNGVHTWTARAYSAIGYSAWAAPVWTVEVTDTLPVPGVPILLAPPNGTITTSRAIAFGWQAGAGGTPQGYNVQVDSGKIITVTDTLSATILSEGAHTWTVRAYNPVGYSGWATPWSIEMRLLHVYLPLVLRRP